MPEVEPNWHLELTPEEMRNLGYRVIDTLIEHLEGLREQPVTRLLDRATTERLLREPVPAHGSDPLDVLDSLRRDVFANIMPLDHPRFFAFVPSPSNFVSAMADALTAGFNVFCGAWLESSGPAQVELISIDWLRQLCGLPDEAGGLFVSGGSMANLTGLAVARHLQLADRTAGAVVYLSDQTHSSVERGLRVLGFSDEQMRKIPTDAAFRLPLEPLRTAIVDDRAAGLMPFCVIANAGTTNTGAIDPLSELADLCQSEGLWLHIDGAYGAAAMITERGRDLLRGLERADSLSLDPHKWLFQPYEIGCVLVRDRHLLREAFHILPEYLRDIDRGNEEVNFCDYGIQLTRSFRALKLWMSLKVFGLDAFRLAVERGFALAEYAEQVLRDSSRWEVISPAQLGIITFRYRSDDEQTDRVNQQIVQAMLDDGYALVTSTVLCGRTVLRLCTINPRTTEDDIRETIRRLEQFGLRAG